MYDISKKGRAFLIRKSHFGSLFLFGRFAFCLRPLSASFIELPLFFERAIFSHTSPEIFSFPMSLDFWKKGAFLQALFSTILSTSFLG